MHVKHLSLLFLGLDWGLELALSLDELLLEGLLPFVHETLVLLVDVVLVVHGLHALLVELAEVLAEALARLGDEGALLQ